MAKIIVTTAGVERHVLTFVPIVSNLVNRGHKIVWISTNRFQSTIQDTGASFVSMMEDQDQLPLDYSYEQKKYPVKSGSCILKTRRKILKDFQSRTQPIMNLLERVLSFFTPDLYLSDSLSYGTFLTAEKYKKPNIVVHTSPYLLPESYHLSFCGKIPFLEKLLGSFGSRIASFLFKKLILKDVLVHINQVRQNIDLYPFKDLYKDMHSLSKEVLITSLAPLENGSFHTPANFQYVGPLLETSQTVFREPDWWNELDECRPVILINQVSIVQDPSELILPLVHAMKDEYVLFVVYPVVKKLKNLPDNVRTLSSVPLANILPKTDLLITNGSCDTIQMALAYGVPMIIADNLEGNKHENYPVQHYGAAIHLKNKTLSGDHLKNTVLEILQDRKFKVCANSLQKHIRQTDPVQDISNIVEHYTSCPLPEPIEETC
ncbi:glycosyltransferase [Flavobacteriaceae bacterium M23B6Z8]